MVRYVANGVDRLDRRAGRHEQGPPLQRAPAGKIVRHRTRDRGGLLHPSFARKAAGQFSRSRFDDPASVALEAVEVIAGRRMSVHIEVHRRGDEHGTTRRQISGQQQVVGHAGSHLRNRIGRSRSDDQRVGPLAERDMAVPLSALRIEKLDENRVAAQRRERQRRDELLGQRSHQYAHFRALADQFPDEYRSLVSCDTACYADDYFLASEHVCDR